MPDAFQVLGLAHRFDLDPALVQRAYLARIAAVHPDAAADETSDGQQAAALNAAKAALEDPLRRAEILLAHLAGDAAAAGGAVAGGAGGGGGGGSERALPPGFLMEMMEVREAADAAREAGDAAEVQRWKLWADERRTELARRVCELLKDYPPGDAQRALAVRTELNMWRYIERMADQLDIGYDPGREFTRRGGALRSLLKFILIAAVAFAVVVMWRGGGGTAATPPAFAEHAGLAAAEQAATTSGKPVLVYFTATWCGPCQRMKRTTLVDPAVAAFIQERTEPAFVDVDLSPADAQKFGVQSIPLTVLVRDGQAVGRLSGAASADEYLKWLDSTVSATAR